jgi:hypothetical protein
VGRLEEQFMDVTGAPLRLATFADPDEAWAAARATVDHGRPAILITDLYYLDHYGKSAHFPGHAVVLAGYDDRVAYLSDTGFEELQTTSLESLRQARHGDLPIFPLSGHMLTVENGAALEDVSAAAPRAIERNARQMIDPPLGDYEGLPALRRFAREVGAWPADAPDWQWCARFGYQVIERRGTGGGNFRLMYSRFLEEAGYDESALAAEAARRWTSLAAALLDASEADEPATDLWARVSEGAASVLAAEERLWQALAP